MVRLNRSLIDERRVAAGLTMQQLVDRIGVRRQFLNGYAADDDTMPIGVLVRLSETLDIPLDQLIHPNPAEPPVPSDDARATAAIFDSSPITRSQLAVALGWTLPAVAASLRRIELRLHGTGLRLRRVGPQSHRIEADLSCLSVGERLRLSHIMIAEDALPANVASVLLAIVRGYGNRRWIQDKVAPDDNCLEVLQRAGLVVAQGRRIDIDPAVGFSLGLQGWDSPDETPPHVQSSDPY